GRSGGFFALDWCDGTPLGPLARASFALHAELARELETDYGYRRMDTFMVAARERGAVGGGHRVEAPGWLDGAGVVTAALGSTETTAQVQPARFTTALIDAATTRGTTLRIGVVEEIAQRDGAARGVRVGSETIEADAVVLAMGPWTSRAARGLRLPAVHGLKGYSDARRRRRACARALRRLPDGRRPRARAGDLSPARRRDLRLRDGRPGATARVGRGRRGEQRVVRGSRPRGGPSVHRSGRGEDHPAPGVLSARHRRRPAADRPHSRCRRRVCRDRPRPLGNAQRASHRVGAERTDCRRRYLAGRSPSLRPGAPPLIAARRGSPRDTPGDRAILETRLEPWESERWPTSRWHSTTST